MPHSAARIYEQSRALQMEASALIVCAATMRACAHRIRAGQIRTVLYEQAAAFETCAADRQAGELSPLEPEVPPVPPESPLL